MAERPSVEQVAEIAGVSVYSVRNYFTRRHLVGIDAARRIRAAVAETGYAPVRQRRKRIGRPFAFVIPREEEEVNVVYAQFEMQLMREARRRQRVMMAILHDEEDETAALYHELFKSGRIAGFVLMDVQYTAEPRLEVIREMQAPCVLIGRAPVGESFSWVDVDQERSLSEVVSHLAAAGHERLGYIGFPPGENVADQRHAGFRKGLDRAGLTKREELERVVTYRNDREAHDAAVDLLGHPSRPTALVCASDDIAFAAIAASQLLGFTIGADMRSGEIAVTGFDDTPQASRAVPSLTSVRQPLSLVAATAIDMLLEQSEPKAPTRSAMYMGSLQLRESA